MIVFLKSRQLVSLCFILVKFKKLLSEKLRDLWDTMGHHAATLVTYFLLSPCYMSPCHASGYLVIFYRGCCQFETSCSKLYKISAPQEIWTLFTKKGMDSFIFYPVQPQSHTTQFKLKAFQIIIGKYNFAVNVVMTAIHKTFISHHLANRLLIAKMSLIERASLWYL